jgi:hypothetical protein
VAEAHDALLVAQGLLQGLAQHDAHVLHAVVGVHVEVALALHLQVEARVGGERSEHVVQEADAGGDLGPPLAVEIQPQPDLGLLGLALDGGGSVHFIASRVLATW